MNNLTLQPQPSQLNGITLYEKVDVNALTKKLNNNESNNKSTAD